MSKGPSQATILVELASGADLFHTPEGEAFATITIDGHRETWPLRTKPVRRWLARQHFEHAEAAPGAQAIQDAIGVLEGRAIFDGSEREVFTRSAEHDGAIYLDLADAGWRAVEITASGVGVVSDPPVRFRRARGMLPLPLPERGGSVKVLREFGNFANDDDFMLAVAWLVAALRPAGPYPVLALHGEQGSAKSTLTEVLRLIVDPNKAPLRAAPKTGHDLMIAATNGWVVAYDNLSHLPDWLSDAICRLATGGGFATRELYTDNEEAIFEAQRPVILNGIEEIATRGDLQDRSIVLELPRIEGHRTEEAFWSDFNRAHPQLLSALLDVVVTAMANMPEVEIAHLPRMADFAKWMEAASPAMGWDPGEFLEAYDSNREDANEITLEASPLTGPIRELGDFKGTATELLEALNELVGERLQRSKVWPKNASALSGALRRLAPNLRRAEPPIEVEFKRESGARTLEIKKIGSEKGRHRRHQRHQTGVNDGDDANDGVFPTHSNGNGAGPGWDPDHQDPGEEEVGAR